MAALSRLGDFHVDDGSGPWLRAGAALGPQSPSLEAIFRLVVWRWVASILLP